jgi:hypothetical protein
MAVKLLNAVVIGGTGGTNDNQVPFKAQVGGAVIGMLDNDKPVKIVDLSLCTEAEKKVFQFSGHWQIFNEAGRPYDIRYPECWMELSHIKVVADPTPEPEPEPDDDETEYEVMSETFEGGRHFLTLRVV